MMKITKVEWFSKKKHGYAEIVDGVRTILMMTEEGTSIVPVKVIGMQNPKKSK